MKSKFHPLGIGLLGAVLLPGLTALSTTRVVSSLGDSGAGTLRDTIAASASDDTIQFAPLSKPTRAALRASFIAGCPILKAV